MKIGIDISQIVYCGTGVATYTRNLVEKILEMDKKNDYVLFGSSFRRQSAFNIFPQTKVYPFPPTLLEILWNQLHTLSVENLIGKVDVFHSSDWTQPPTKAKKVTTVHDLLVYKYPEVSHNETKFRWDTLSPSANIVASQKRRMELVKKECDLVIAVSESTKKDLMEILKIPEEKIRVIYEATNIIPTNQTKYKFEKPYVLAVGTRDQRKNLDRLVQSFNLLKNKDVELVIAGKYGWGNAISNEQSTMSNIKLLGYVPNEDLPGLYANAQVFVYPSLYEGFGIPILEAFNCGCPVVTSNISSLPEVGGKAAIYVDPLSTSDIAEKLDYVLALCSSKRKKLIEQGISQACKFSWEKAAQETLKVYQALL